MQKSLLVAMAALMGAATIAEARPSTTAMTCAQATATVASAGKIVLSTGPHTFDRFVSGGMHCMPGERAHAVTAPTIDMPHCRLGFTCKRRAPRFHNDF